MELTITERATKALSIDITEAQLKALAKETKDVTEIKDKADYQLVKTAAIKLRDTRVVIEKAGKAARDDATQFSKAVIQEERRLIGLIGDEEERLKAMRKQVDDEKERIEREAAEKEATRIENIHAQVANIYKLAEGLLNAPSSEIRDRLVLCGKIDLSLFEEFQDAAVLAANSTREALERGLKARVELEEQQAEQARVAAEQAKKQAELDAQAEKQGKVQERIEEERRDAARAMAEAQQKAEVEKQRAEQERLAEERIERERKEAVEQAKQAEAARVAEEARQAMLLPAKEKLLAWAGEIKNIEPPAGIRAKAQQAIVAKALKDLGEVGNYIIAQVKTL